MVEKDYQVRDADPNEKMGLIMIGGDSQKQEGPSNVKDKQDLYYELMDKQEKAKKEEKVEHETKKEKLIENKLESINEQPQKR